MTDDLRSAALESKAWPYEEARKLLKRYPDGKAGGAPARSTGTPISAARKARSVSSAP